MKKILLTQGEFAIVDDGMFDSLSAFRWCVTNDGQNKYAIRSVRINGRNTKIWMHHAVVGYPLNKKQIDHVDGNGLNNRRENLRIVTQRENSSNQKLHRAGGQKTSRFVGVFWCKGSNKWRASFRINNRLIHLGYFVREEDARDAYDERRKKETVAI